MEVKYIKIDKAALLVDVSPYTVRKWIKERKLRYYKFGGAVRIRISDLLSFAVEYEDYSFDSDYEEDCD